MKKLLTLLAAISMLFVACSKDEEGGNSTEQLPPMSDPNDVCTAMDDIDFMKYCYTFFDVNKDGKVSIAEAEAVREMKDFYHSEYQGNGHYKTVWSVQTLKGIEYFKNLTTLSLNHRITQTEVDLSRLLNLRELSLDGSGILKLTIAGDKLCYLSTPDRLSKLYIRSSTPPSYWYVNIYSPVEIYVPHSVVEAYKAAEGWSEYADYIYGY